MVVVIAVVWASTQLVTSMITGTDYTQAVAKCLLLFSMTVLQTMSNFTAVGSNSG